MKRIPKKQMNMLREIDLLTYFSNYYPDELIRNGQNDYRTRSHSSLHLSNGMWFYWAKGIGGKSALDYLIKVEEYTFEEAIHHLNSMVSIKEPLPAKSVSKRRNIFRLPQKDESNTDIRNYLIRLRCISESVVEYCIVNHLIYQSKNDKSVVFVGYDEFNCPRFACKRATDSDWRRDVLGSNKSYGFSLSNWTSTSLHVFEAPIDLLSFLTILEMEGKNYLDMNYLALAGVSGQSFPALENYLLKHGNIRSIYLHLDNDDAGKTATKAIRDKYQNLYYVFDRNPKDHKDVNEELWSRINEKV